MDKRKKISRGICKSPEQREMKDWNMAGVREVGEQDRIVEKNQDIEHSNEV